MEEDKEYQRYKDEKNYRQNILEAILVSSIDGNRNKFPAITKHILSELKNGTIKYIGGNAGRLTYTNSRIEPENLEKYFYKYLKSALDCNSNQELNPKIKEALEELCKPYRIEPTGPDRPFLSIELYDHLGLTGNQISDIIIDRTFTILPEIIKKVEEKTLPNLTESEIKDITGIGKSMRKYIEEDLDFIKNIYCY